MENTSYWRGKVRVFEIWYGDGRKVWVAEYRKHLRGFGNYWDSVDGDEQDPAPREFAKPDDAVVAAKTAWEQEHGKTETYRRKIWP